MSKVPQKPIVFAASGILLTVTLGAVAFAVTHIKPGTTLWQRQSGQTLTQMHVLPLCSWGFKDAPMTMMAFTGPPTVCGTTTKYGFVQVNRYDLRIWRYDPQSGILVYEEW